MEVKFTAEPVQNARNTFRISAVSDPKATGVNFQTALEELLDMAGVNRLDELESDGRVTGTLKFPRQIDDPSDSSDVETTLRETALAEGVVFVEFEVT